MWRHLASFLAIGGVTLLSARGLAQAPSQAPDDALVAAFLGAAASDARDSAARAIVARTPDFDTVYSALKRGRVYSTDVPHGVVQGSYVEGGTQFFYTLDVPQSYSPERRYQLRVQLHGGVGRIETSAAPATAGGGRLSGAEQIYLMPYAWRDAPWWSRRQTTNLRTLIDRTKRAYNIDENRIVLMGVSDGGTGAYFSAMRDTTPFASFVPLNGFIMVLRNEMASADGDVFPNNLRMKPIFAVNGGRDPLYPTSVVDGYIDHLQKAGVDLVYRPQAGAGHDTSWWPALKDTIEQFVAEHPRRPLPDRLSWETSEAPARAHWLVIDQLGPTSDVGEEMADANRRDSAPVEDFGARCSGPRINRVVPGSNAQQLGLQAGDVVAAFNGQPIAPTTDLVEALAAFPRGRPLIFSVNRQGQSVRLTGRYNPSVLPGDAKWLFTPERPSGRVDVVRTGNHFEVHARGVTRFTLLLSPDQVDFDKPVTVRVNGRTTVERAVSRDLATLLRWAGRDDDRTMLFAAELPVTVE